MLPANGPILRALALPSFYGVSNASEVGIDEFMRRLGLALSRGLKLVQLREKAVADDQVAALAPRVIALAHAHGASVLLNGDPELAERVGADGVHLTAARLMRAEARPRCELVGASCHDARELMHAARLGLDFVVLGPVKATASHPDAAVLGWRRFGELIAGYALPVYAVGASPTTISPLHGKLVRTASPRSAECGCQRGHGRSQ